MRPWKILQALLEIPTVAVPASPAPAPGPAASPARKVPSEAPHPPEAMTCPLATRVTVIGRDGRVFEDYDLFDNGCTVVVQDEGRTVKVLRQ